MGEGPCDREPLALTAGHVGAALGDRRVELLGLGLDEVAGLRDLERLPHLGVGGVRVAEAHVAGHGAREQEWLLGHEADDPLEQPLVEVAHVDAVDEHLTPGDVEQARR